MNRFYLRLLLSPLAIIYGSITSVRNFLYDLNILKSTSFDIPVINVGNLSVGGTGKTPQIEYLIRLLQQEYKIAVISRGYKRKTKGFIVAYHNATPENIGDEPYQIYRKFKHVIVAVGENRVNAIRKVLDKFSPGVILLDDAFQHRRVNAGLNLLLTPYATPFYKDFILPAGHLREARDNAQRADIVLVTKSPNQLTDEQKTAIKKAIKKYTKAPVFFSSIAYDDQIYSQDTVLELKDLTGYQILLITGIANPQPLYSFLSEKNLNFDSLKFGDHHHFSEADIQKIKQKFKGLKASKRIILTTEKDYVRLSPHLTADLFYLSIQTKIEKNELFNKKILNYVRDNQ